MVCSVSQRPNLVNAYHNTSVGSVAALIIFSYSVLLRNYSLLLRWYELYFTMKTAHMHTVQFKLFKYGTVFLIL